MSQRFNCHVDHLDSVCFRWTTAPWSMRRMRLCSLRSEWFCWTCVASMYGVDSLFLKHFYINYGHGSHIQPLLFAAGWILWHHQQEPGKSDQSKGRGEAFNVLSCVWEYYVLMNYEKPLILGDYNTNQCFLLNSHCVLKYKCISF